jgi:hypothetical protein
VKKSSKYVTGETRKKDLWVERDAWITGTQTTTEHKATGWIREMMYRNPGKIHIHTVAAMSSRLQMLDGSALELYRGNRHHVITINQLAPTNSGWCCALTKTALAETQGNMGYCYAWQKNECCIFDICYFFASSNSGSHIHCLILIGKPACVPPHIYLPTVVLSFLSRVALTWTGRHM